MQYSEKTDRSVRGLKIWQSTGPTVNISITRVPYGIIYANMGGSSFVAVPPEYFEHFNPIAFEDQDERS